MRPVYLPEPPRSPVILTPEMRFVAAALAEIQTASRENDQRVIATAFSPENIVPLRTLDGATATMTDVANFIGTLVLDLRAGEVRKG